MTKKLKHYGILGMHWGVTTGGSAGSGSGSGRGGRTGSSGHPDHVQTASLRRKRIKDLSNEELTTITKRLQLEKSYKDLSSNNVSSGQKFVTDLVSGILKKQIGDLFNSGIGLAGKIIKDTVDKNRD